MRSHRPWYRFVPLVLLLAACSADPVSERPSLELVDIAQRLDAKLVNAHTYGTFVLTFGGGPSAILSGPANFPGNPPGGPGTCEDGLWINSKGKRTAGSLTNPHPHCTRSESAMEVVLEPISSQTHDPRQACEIGAVCAFLLFDLEKSGDLTVQYRSGIKGERESTTGLGTVVAYAIDASTLNTTNERVGILSIDLAQYTAEGNMFGTCDMGIDEVQCLPQVVTATYKPYTVGTAQTVTGFLWWAPATAPYNY